MPGPGAIVGLHERYKRATNKFVAWLVRKADRCCDITTIVPSLSDASSLPRCSSIKLRTAELLQLAKAIKATTPAPYIPAEVLDLLRDIIRLRQLSAIDHAAKSMRRGKILSEEDESHQHFICVLQEVLDLLISTRAANPPATTEQVLASPTCEPGKKKRKGKKAPRTFDFTTDSDIPRLEEEVQDANPDAVATDSIGKAGVDLAHLEFELESREDGLSFALLCHLRDLHDARKFICQAWLDYREGKVSHLAASMVAETGFALMKCADHQFCALNPSLSDFGGVLNALALEEEGMAHGKVPGAITFISRRAQASPVNGIELPNDILDLLCPAAAVFLEVRMDSFERLGRNFKRKATGSAIEGPSRSETAYRKCHDFIETVLGNFGMFRRTASGDKHTGRLDELVSELGKTKRRPIWLVVACQTYMDIFDMLGSDSSSGLSLVKRSLSDFEGLCQKQRSREAVAIDTAAEHVRRAIQMLDLNTDALDGTDTFCPAFKKQRQSFLDCFNVFTTKLEPRLPVHAGATAFFVKAWMANRAYSVSNGSALALHSMAYVYRLARHFGLLDIEWPDMEFAITFGSANKLLLPKLNGSAKPGQYLPAFKAALGLREDGGSPTTAEYKVNLDRGTSVTFGATLASRIVGDATDPTKQACHASTGKIVEIILHQMASEEARQSEELKSSGRAAQLRESFTPTELLNTFKSTFIREEPILNFNMYDLYLDCEDFLNSVASAVGPACLSGAPPSPAETAWAILVDAEELTFDSILPSSSKLHRIIEPLERLIRASGNKHLKGARDQSSGYIPKSLRPNLGSIYEDRKKSENLVSAPVRSAGATVVYSGRIASVYHPSLTSTEVKDLVDNAAGLGHSHLPSYMVANEGRLKGAEAYDSKDGQWRMWLPWPEV